VRFVIHLMPKAPTKNQIQDMLTLLEDTPKRIAASTMSFNDGQLAQASNPDDWSALEILAHLRACADLWGYSIYAMLAKAHPHLAKIHPRRWTQVAGYTNLGFERSLRAFDLERQELLSVLRPLLLESWSRSADIGGRTHTVFSQARRMALHEQDHCEQIEALLALAG
jgi:hypothetical protein